MIIKKYWKLDFSKNYSYSAEKFSNNFRNNLNLHLRSDVPIAFTLSGGLDSSSLLKTALDLKIDNYKAFSIKSSFEDEDDESKYIDIAKNILNNGNYRIDRTGTGIYSIFGHIQYLVEAVLMFC